MHIYIHIYGERKGGRGERMGREGKKAGEEG